MGKFNEAMKGMAEKIEDLSSLEVTTFQGRVQLQGQGTAVPGFDQIMTKVLNDTSVNAKVLASTRMNVDGDIVVFFDEEITAEQKQAHAELVKIGVENRTATLKFIKDAIGDISGL